MALLKIKEAYTGLSTTRTAVESAPVLNASKVNLKARKSNTEWKEENELLGIMNVDFDYDPSSASARQEGFWQTDF